MEDLHNFFKNEYRRQGKNKALSDLKHLLMLDSWGKLFTDENKDRIKKLEKTLYNLYNVPEWGSYLYDEEDGEEYSIQIEYEYGNVIECMAEEYSAEEIRQFSLEDLENAFIKWRNETVTGYVNDDRSNMINYEDFEDLL